MAVPAEFLTARLQLSPPRLQDAPALYAFMGDAQVMRHTYRKTSLRDMRRHIAAHWWQARRVGFGCWTVRHEGKVVGFGGLNDDPLEPGYGPEVAYFFAPEARGKGFAGEVVAASLEEARRLALPSVRAFVHPDNAASRRVLERTGFTIETWVPAMTRWLLRIELGGGMKSDAVAALRDAVQARGLVPGEAKAKRGKPGVTLVWLRPEPVTLRLDAKGVLWLDAYLPWVMPGGMLHRQVKAHLAAHGALSASRNGQLSVGMAGGAAALPALLAAAQGLRDLLQAEWPDYATGVFAKALT